MAEDVRSVTVELVRPGVGEQDWVDVAYEGDHQVPELVRVLREAVEAGDLPGVVGSRIVVIRHRPGPVDVECGCVGGTLGEGCELVESHNVS